MENPLLFALAVLTILVTPGPTNTLLATGGATLGMQRALRLIPAEAAGYTISILVIGLLLGPVLAANPLLSLGMRLAVGAYLLWLALRLWRHGSEALALGRVVTPAQLFLTTLLNPKAIIFALGIIPFGADPVWPYMLGFLAMLAAVALGWIAIGAVLGGAAQRRGWSGSIPRLGAAAVGTFAAILLIAPLIG